MTTGYVTVFLYKKTPFAIRDQKAVGQAKYKAVRSSNKTGTNNELESGVGILKISKT